jgi:hypothetical protein
VLKIGAQVFFRKTGKKFRLCGLVDLTDAVYQLPFAHGTHPQNPERSPHNYRNIDIDRFFSLTNPSPPAPTPHNLDHYMSELPLYETATYRRVSGAQAKILVLFDFPSYEGEIAKSATLQEHSETEGMN